MCAYENPIVYILVVFFGDAGHRTVSSSRYFHLNIRSQMFELFNRFAIQPAVEGIFCEDFKFF